MKYSLTKIISQFKRNLDIILLVVLIFFVGSSIQIYNLYKYQKKENFSKVLNNIYFKKTLSHIFDNFDPRYLTIEHKVSSGETLNGILEKHKIPKLEIKKIIKEFNKIKKKRKLKK